MTNYDEDVERRWWNTRVSVHKSKYRSNGHKHRCNKHKYERKHLPFYKHKHRNIKLQKFRNSSLVYLDRNEHSAYKKMHLEMNKDELSDISLEDIYSDEDFDTLNNHATTRKPSFSERERVSSSCRSDAAEHEISKLTLNRKRSGPYSLNRRFRNSASSKSSLEEKRRIKSCSESISSKKISAGNSKKRSNEKETENPPSRTVSFLRRDIERSNLNSNASQKKALPKCMNKSNALNATLEGNLKKKQEIKCVDPVEQRTTELNGTISFAVKVHAVDSNNAQQNGPTSPKSFSATKSEKINDKCSGKEASKENIWKIPPKRNVHSHLKQHGSHSTRGKGKTSGVKECPHSTKEKDETPSVQVQSKFSNRDDAPREQYQSSEETNTLGKGSVDSSSDMQQHVKDDATPGNKLCLVSTIGSEECGLQSIQYQPFQSAIDNSTERVINDALTAWWPFCKKKEELKVDTPITKEQKEAALIAKGHEKLYPSKKRISHLTKHLSGTDISDNLWSITPFLTIDNKTLSSTSNTPNETTTQLQKALPSSSCDSDAADIVGNIKKLMDAPIGTFTIATKTPLSFATIQSAPQTSVISKPCKKFQSVKKSGPLFKKTQKQTQDIRRNIELHKKKRAHVVTPKEEHLVLLQKNPKENEHKQEEGTKYKRRKVAESEYENQKTVKKHPWLICSPTKERACRNKRLEQAKKIAELKQRKTEEKKNYLAAARGLTQTEDKKRQLISDFKIPKLKKTDKSAEGDEILLKDKFSWKKGNSIKRGREIASTLRTLEGSKGTLNVDALVRENSSDEEKLCESDTEPNSNLVGQLKGRAKSVKKYRRIVLLSDLEKGVDESENKLQKQNEKVCTLPFSIQTLNLSDVIPNNKESRNTVQESKTIEKDGGNAQPIAGRGTFQEQKPKESNPHSSESSEKAVLSAGPNSKLDRRKSAGRQKLLKAKTRMLSTDSSDEDVNSVYSPQMASNGDSTDSGEFPSRTSLVQPELITQNSDRNVVTAEQASNCANKCSLRDKTNRRGENELCTEIEYKTANELNKVPNDSIVHTGLSERLGLVSSRSNSEELGGECISRGVGTLNNEVEKEAEITLNRCTRSENIDLEREKMGGVILNKTTHSSMGSSALECVFPMENKVDSAHTKVSSCSKVLTSSEETQGRCNEVEILNSYNRLQTTSTSSLSGQLERVPEIHLANPSSKINCYSITNCSSESMCQSFTIPENNKCAIDDSDSSDEVVFIKEVKKTGRFNALPAQLNEPYLKHRAIERTINSEMTDESCHIIQIGEVRSLTEEKGPCYNTAGDSERPNLPQQPIATHVSAKTNINSTSERTNEVLLESFAACVASADSVLKNNNREKQIAMLSELMNSLSKKVQKTEGEKIQLLLNACEQSSENSTQILTPPVPSRESINSSSNEQSVPCINSCAIDVHSTSTHLPTPSTPALNDISSKPVETPGPSCQPAVSTNEVTAINSNIPNPRLWTGRCVICHRQQPSFCSICNENCCYRVSCIEKHRKLCHS